MERNAFLQQIRSHLDSREGVSSEACPRYHPDAPFFGDTPEDLTRVFLERQAQLGVFAEAVPSRRNAETAVERLLEDHKWKFVCSPGLCWREVARVRSEHAAQAGFGLSEAWLAIAETGSIVLRMGGAERRDTSLLPPAVGFIVARSSLVARLGDVLRLLAANRELVPTCLTMVTGPSASADIVGVRTLGVHGPGEVHVWVIESE